MNTANGAVTGSWALNTVAAEWAHTLNRTGEATVDLAGMVGKCCQQFERIRPWADTLLITDGGVVEFGGPVQQIGISGDGKAMITAADWGAWTDARWVRDPVNIGEFPIIVSDFVRQVIRSGFRLLDPLPGGVSVFDCATVTTRAVDPSTFPTVGATLAPLLGTVIDMGVSGPGIEFRCAGECFGSLGTISAPMLKPGWALGRDGDGWVTAAASQVRLPDGSLLSASVGGPSEVYGVLVEGTFTDDATATTTAALQQTLTGRIRQDMGMSTAPGTDEPELVLRPGVIDLSRLTVGACVLLDLDACTPVRETVRVLSVRGSFRKGVVGHRVTVGD